MNKLTITLKQHTPLLHFQPMQEDATLRASEVKPKLDKFLIEKLGEGNYDQGVEIAKQKGWLLMDGKNDCKALNYKMRIESSNPIDMQLPTYEHFKNENGKKVSAKEPCTGKQLFKTAGYPSKNKTLIIGNIEGRVKHELLDLKYYKSNQVIIHSINTGILNFVSNHIAVFFSIYNFGNRQSKGFGSYEVVCVNDKNVSTQDVYFDYIKRISFYLDPKDSQIVTLEGAIKDTFRIIGGLWEALTKDIKVDKPFLECAKIEGKSCDRVPSVITFKPFIEYEEEGDTCVYIYCLVNSDVVNKAEIDENCLSDRIDTKISWKKLKDVVRSSKTAFYVNDIEIK